MGRKRIKPIKPPKYEYLIGDECIYIGGLYDQFQGLECEVIDRSFSKRRAWYKILIKNTGSIVEILPSEIKRREES